MFLKTSMLLTLLLVGPACKPSVDGGNLLRAEQVELTLSDLVSANQQALDLIDRIELEVTTIERNFLRGRPFGEPATSTWAWARDRTRERTRFSTGEAAPLDSAQGFNDWFLDGDKLYLLQNWDPSNPQTITPNDQRGVRARIVPRTRKPLGRDVARFLLWKVALDISDDSRTLSELVRESPNSALVGPSICEGHSVWHIRAQHPGVDGTPRENFIFDIYIDPSVNFHIRRVVEHHEGFELDVDGRTETYSMDITRTVKSFRDFGDGVFVPESVLGDVAAHTSDERRTELATSVEVKHVNEPLSADALDFRFPPNTLVIVGPPVTPDHQKVLLWGAENQPLREIQSDDDLAEYATPIGPKRDVVIDTAPKPRTLLWINLTVIVAIVIALIVNRKRAAPHQPADASSERRNLDR